MCIFLNIFLISLKFLFHSFFSLDKIHKYSKSTHTNVNVNTHSHRTNPPRQVALIAVHNIALVMVLNCVFYIDIIWYFTRLLNMFSWLLWPCVCALCCVPAAQNTMHKHFPRRHFKVYFPRCAFSYNFIAATMVCCTCVCYIRFREIQTHTLHTQTIPRRGKHSSIRRRHRVYTNKRIQQFYINFVSPHCFLSHSNICIYK